jgi:hypothetical protein
MAAIFGIVAYLLYLALFFIIGCKLFYKKRYKLQKRIYGIYLLPSFALICTVQRMLLSYKEVRIAYFGYVLNSPSPSEAPNILLIEVPSLILWISTAMHIYFW